MKEIHSDRTIDVSNGRQSASINYYSTILATERLDTLLEVVTGPKSNVVALVMRYESSEVLWQVVEYSLADRGKWASKSVCVGIQDLVEARVIARNLVGYVEVPPVPRQFSALCKTLGMTAIDIEQCWENINTQDSTHTKNSLVDIVRSVWRVCREVTLAEQHSIKETTSEKEGL